MTMNKVRDLVARTWRLPRFQRDMIIMFLSCFIMGATALTFSYLLIRQSERRWCDTLTTITEGYTAPASSPPTERGRRLAQNLVDLRRQYHC